MKKKSLLVVCGMAALMLAACGGGADESKPASNGGSTPTSSQTKPASSSKSSTSKAPVKSMTVASIDVAVKENKAYAVVKGTAKNYAEGEFKWAWGLEHVTSIDGGEGFAYGSATPTDADYKEVVKIEADGSYTAEFCFSDIEIDSGLYKVYAGAKGYYDGISGEISEVTKNRVKDGKKAYSYRYDEECNGYASVAIDLLPPIALQEATVYEEEGKTWVRIGGESTITEADAATYTPFLQFQNVGNWRNTKMAQDQIRWNFKTAGKAYIEADVTKVFVAGVNLNTHLNITTDKQQDCKMETAIDEHYIINGVDIEVFSDPTSTAEREVGFWGNLGFRCTAAPVEEDPDAPTVYKAEKDFSSVLLDGAATTETTYKLGTTHSLEWKINAKAAGKADLYFQVAQNPANKAKPIYKSEEKGIKYAVTVNGEAVALENETDTSESIDPTITGSSGLHNPIWAKYASVNVKAGENVINIAGAVDDYRLNFYGCALWSEADIF